jgi:hypothetical protein
MFCRRAGDGTCEPVAEASCRNNFKPLGYGGVVADVIKFNNRRSDLFNFRVFNI